MLPMAESANSEFQAAVILANVSGSDVPRATRVMAVIDSLILSTHPRILAISPTIPVTSPIMASDTTKQAEPPQQLGGGIKAKNTFQPIARKWNTASARLTSSRMIFSSSMEGPSMTASLNYCIHVGSLWAMKYSIRRSLSSSSRAASSLLEIVTKQIFFFEILTPRGSGFSSLILKVTSQSSSSSSSSPSSPFSTSYGTLLLTNSMEIVFSVSE